MDGVKRGILNRAQKHVGYERINRVNKPWTKENMIKKMDERRRRKNKNSEEGNKKYNQ